MPRFLDYVELTNGTRIPMTDFRWLAGKVANSAPFRAGVAVLCGSTAWDSQTWLSDIDILHYRTAEFPDISETVQSIVQEYSVRTQEKFLVPRAEVITIGSDLTTDSPEAVPALSNMPVTAGGNPGETSPSMLLRFSDHVGSLAVRKGDPWREFHQRFLSAVQDDPIVRKDDILKYVSTIGARWAQEPFNTLELAADGSLTADQLSLLSQAESFPIHLMRRVLGRLGRYPSPDRAVDIREAFAGLGDDWSSELLSALKPFLAIEGKYNDIVAAAGSSAAGLTQREYYDRLRALVDSLPFAHIEEIMWRWPPTPSPLA